MRDTRDAEASPPKVSPHAPPAKPGLSPGCYRTRRRAETTPVHHGRRQQNRAGRRAAAQAQEAVVDQAISRQHPAVVLRSQYQHLRSLLVVAMFAVIGLTAAVVILATQEDQVTSGGSASQVSTPAQPQSLPRAVDTPSPRAYIGAIDAATTRPATRYDGGPEEGTLDLAPAAQTNSRYDGGPEEGTRGQLKSIAPSDEANSGPQGPGFRTH
jgi:hypothetical protein